jgi:hypothetical protein
LSSRWLLALAALCAVAAAGASGAAVEPELRAFERPKRATDVLRGSFARHFRVTDSRRIATYTDRRGRRTDLYVAKTRTQLCIVAANSNGPGAISGSGGGCSPKADFFDGRHVAASSGRLVHGVVANDVSRVVLVGSRGVRHQARLTRDGGFIHDCRAYNGCAGLIACVEAYGADGSLLSAQQWLPGGCRRR